MDLKYFIGYYTKRNLHQSIPMQAELKSTMFYKEMYAMQIYNYFYIVAIFIW